MSPSLSFCFRHVATYHSIGIRYMYIDHHPYAKHYILHEFLKILLPLEFSTGVEEWAYKTSQASPCIFCMFL